MSVLSLQRPILLALRALALATTLLSGATAIAQSANAQTAAAPGAAVAPPPVPLPLSPMSAATAAEIQKINEQMTLLQAQLNELELKARIASKQKEINGSPATPPVQSSFDTRNGNPSVVSVAGIKGNLEAVLVFPGGVTTRVRAGDVIDQRRVAKVAINEVVLTDLKGGSVQRLAFGSTPMTREQTLLPSVNGTPATPVFPLPPAMPQAALR